METYCTFDDNGFLIKASRYITIRRGRGSVMRIGMFAKLNNISIDTIRYYMDLNLKRIAVSGYCTFDPDTCQYL